MLETFSRYFDDDIPSTTCHWTQHICAISSHDRNQEHCFSQRIRFVVDETTIEKDDAEPAGPVVEVILRLIGARAHAHGVRDLVIWLNLGDDEPCTKDLTLAYPWVNDDVHNGATIESATYEPIKRLLPEIASLRSVDFGVYERDLFIKQELMKLKDEIETRTYRVAGPRLGLRQTT